MGFSVKAVDAKGKPVEIDVGEDLVKEILRELRKQGKAESRFDLNLQEGKQAETELLSLLGDTTIEVKRDFGASKTGNVAVEYMCGGKPSGISTSTANWWAFALSGEHYKDEVIILIKKERLLDKLLPSRIRRGGDNKKAEMYLVAVEELVK